MRPVVFGEALLAGTRLTLFSAEAGPSFYGGHVFDGSGLGVMLDLKTRVPCYQFEDGRRLDPLVEGNWRTRSGYMSSRSSPLGSLD
jgi:hypothetical protein